MRKLSLVLLLGLLSGCMNSGATPEQIAELRTISVENKALVDEHKITHVEAATRYNAAIERLATGPISERDHLFMSYRVALASQIDAGQITPETAKFQLEQQIAAYNAQDRAANAAALYAVGNSMREAADAARPRQPINCNSVPSGSSINTTCY